MLFTLENIITSNVGKCKIGAKTHSPEFHDFGVNSFNFKRQGQFYNYFCLSVLRNDNISKSSLFNIVYGSKKHVIVKNAHAGNLQTVNWLFWDFSSVCGKGEVELLFHLEIKIQLVFRHRFSG